jgi:hypothetical protein
VVAGPSITSDPLPGGEVGVAYAATPAASGGTGEVTWSVTGALPAGLTVDPATGAVSGTPTDPGTAAFTLVATDGAGVAGTQDESVTVIGGPTITSAPLPGGDAGVAYAVTPSLSGGSGSVTWSVTDGALPDGLALDPSSGAVTGTPTTPGSSSFVLRAMDGAGGTAAQDESLTVADPLAISSQPLPGGYQGGHYDGTPAATGGTAPLSWSVTGGPLPDGLTLDPSTGEIAGTPTGTGTSSFTLRVTDAAGASATQDESVDVLPELAITSDPFPGGEVGAPYAATPAATGGTGSYGWAVVGSLPAGLSLDPSTGALTGTPTTAGTATFALVLSDGGSPVADQQESVSVTAGPSVTSDPLPGGEVGAPYDVTPAMAGGTGPFTWSVGDGTLPAGLTLDPTTGEVAGTPTDPGTATFTLRTTDGLGVTGTQTESVDVVPSLSVAPGPLVTGETGVAYDATPAMAGGTGPFTWSVGDGTLPAGLDLDAATGAVTGTPTVPGTSTFTVRVTDPRGGVSSASESVTVVDVPSVVPATVDGTVGAPLADQLVVTGGTGPFHWSVTSGALPAGLTLASDGMVSGVPMTAGTATVTVTTSDRYDSTGSGHVSVTVLPSALNSRTIATTPDGRGYWVVTADGAVDAFGDARSHGSLAGRILSAPVVGIAATPDGGGYWLVASDGGVFAFGDATFHGSAGGLRLNRPVDGIESTPDGRGYWLAAGDGGVFAFGDAGFLGSDPAPMP